VIFLFFLIGTLVFSLYQIATVNAVAVFSDGFESGTTEAWTGTSGNPAVGTSQVHSGTYSEEANATEYVYKNMGVMAEVYMRCYVRFSECPDANSEEIAFMYGVASGTSVFCARAYYTTARHCHWSISYRAGSTWTSVEQTTSDTIVINHWYEIEMHWIKNNSTGEVHLLVDNVATIDITGADTDNYGNFGTARLGCGYASTGGEAFTVYIDNVVVSATSIGPEAAYTVDLSQALTYAESTIQTCAYTVLPSNSLTVTGSIELVTMFLIDSNQSLVLESGTYTQSTLSVYPSENMTFIGESLLSSSFSVNPSLAIVTGWIGEFLKAFHVPEHLFSDLSIPFGWNSTMAFREGLHNFADLVQGLVFSSALNSYYTLGFGVGVNGLEILAFILAICAIALVFTWGRK
jgi:hypothetical protein